MGTFAFVTFLTLVRAPLVVAGTLCVLANLAWPSPAILGVGAGLMALSAVTDLFDGLLARRWGVASRFGALADPLMDKVFWICTMPAATFVALYLEDVRHAAVLLALDVAVIVAFAVIFRKFDSSMYAIICMFIAAKVIDLVLYGAINSKVCYIITDASRDVKDAIVTKLRRGVTFLHGEGAWSGAQKNVILCVIKQQQIVELKKLVEAIDEKAFMIVSDSREVFGKGFAYIGDED
jgi:phosphatidylglycerophosphate synthase